MVKIGFICTSLLLLITLHVSSQSIVRSVISVTGNTTSDSKGLLSYSVGEAITGCFFNPTNGLTQGFQQPSLINFFDIEAAGLAINAVEAFPNPVINDITLLFNLRNPKVLHVDIVSSQGIPISSAQYIVSEAGSIFIEMNGLPPGFYFLHAYSKDKLIDRVFKIEKM